MPCFLRNVCGFIATSPSETWSNYINLLNIIWITLSPPYTDVCCDSLPTRLTTNSHSPSWISFCRGLPPPLSWPLFPQKAAWFHSHRNYGITRMLMKNQPGAGQKGNHLRQDETSFHLQVWEGDEGKHQEQSSPNSFIFKKTNTLELV